MFLKLYSNQVWKQEGFCTLRFVIAVNTTLTYKLPKHTGSSEPTFSQGLSSPNSHIRVAS